MKRVVLMGFMGAGKTTIGKALAKEFSCGFIDTDEMIEQVQGRKISEIFEKEGESAFRDMETELLRKLQNRTDMFVLSIGGGMPVREENRALLRDIGTVVYLKATKEELLRRLSGDTQRPLLQGGGLEEKITTLMDARAEIYANTAHRQLETDGRTIDDILKELKEINRKDNL